MPDYIKQIRNEIGNKLLIHPAARIIIEDDNENFLFIQKVENNKWGIPAGGIELDETIEECIIREVLEETGLKLISLEVIGISSSPTRETVQYNNGDVVQYFTIEFYSNHWEGKLGVNDVTEIQLAKFKSSSHIELLPENEKHAFDSLNHYRKTGKVNLT